MTHLRFDAFMLLLGLGIAVILLTGRRHSLVPFSMALPRWASALVTLCIGILLIGVGENAANPWPTLAGKVLVAAANALFLYAVMQATGTGRSPATLFLLLAPIVAVFVLSVAMVLTSPSAPLQSGLLSLLMAGFVVAASVLLLGDLRRGSAGTIIGLLVAFGTSGICHVIRGVVIVDYPELEAHWPTLTHDLLTVSTLAMIAGSVAFALTASNRLQAEYLTLANRDELTGLSNRRAFNRIASRFFERARSQHGRLAALMIDIDHFKRINDRLGHAEGDRVLIRIAASISASVDPGDVIARLGGEEFCALLPGASDVQAIDTAEKIRRSVAHGTELADGTEVTVSVGVAMLGAQDHTLDCLMERADAALLSAKLAGRNRVCVADTGAGTGANVLAMTRRSRRS